MASIGITAFTVTLRACSSNHHLTKKRRPPAAASVVTNVETIGKQESATILMEDPLKEHENPVQHLDGPSPPRFFNERWKNGTWDLNMFVKQGRMDWDAVIVAEARRRKFLEAYPEASTNEEPVKFRSSVIPLWAWIVHSHLPEAELLNGRAAMVGFFAGYVVDALTGLDMIGQAGNFICKLGLFAAVIGVMVVRRKEDVDNVRKLVDEATFYDKQWQASWKKSEDENVVENTKGD
ncbi:light-harvesting complex-like protein 3 isotype 1, chloroplastic [Andrographis paniculata]|uniref:light-harvesting complex-like protein 3 isotype 1, chloroplastic n=1 Tax=Andrographis paniculata TaxID=175694 RepID=UPI0021E78366|nr:light-harvesting complex-like protein 3 isotype 1, chloroplastic [Andrographis paniculata]